MNSIPSVNTGTMTARGVSRRGEAAARLEDGVEQRHPALRHREQAADGVRQSLGVVGVVHEDRRTIGQSDDRDMIARSPSSPRSSTGRVRRNVMSSRAAALLSTRIATSIGSVARDTRRTSRLTPSSRDLERIGTEVGHRFAFAIDCADEHHAFAERPGPRGAPLKELPLRQTRPRRQRTIESV